MTNEMVSPASSALWTAPQKIAFRFFALFFILNILPFPLGDFPIIGEPIMNAYTVIQNSIIQFLGSAVFEIKEPINTEQTGSGDRTMDWLFLLFTTITTIIGSLLWTVIDRKRPNYSRLADFVNVYLRYFLAYNMISYGLIKVFHLQMPAPGLSRLTQTFGEASPMGLLWTMVGFSKAYSAFVGGAEVLGGLLLLFRRTTLLGALISALVMLNVAVMNFTFDVPVKRFSVFLMLISIYLAAPSLMRLFRFFVLHKNIEDAPVAPLFTNKIAQIASYIPKIALIGAFFYSEYTSINSTLKEYSDAMPLPPLYGCYEVQTIHKKDSLVPPLLTDSTYWHQLIVDKYPGYMQIRTATRKKLHFSYTIDSVKHEITLKNNVDTLKTGVLVYEKTSPTAVVFRGVFANDSLTITTKRSVDSDFRLMKRGFNWVSEYPYNR